MKHRLSALAVCALLVSCSESQNNPPQLVPPGDLMVDVGTPVSVTLTATDPDSNAVTLALVSGPEGARLEGTVISWTPADPSTAGVHAVVVSATDDGKPALTAYAAFTITVRDPKSPAANRPPILLPPSDMVLDAGAPLSLTLTAVDPDGDHVTFSVIGPTGVTITDSALAWTPSGPGVYGFLVTARDDRVPPLASYATFSVTVKGTRPPVDNRPPIIVPPSDQELAPGASLSLALVAADPDGDAVTLSVTGPAGAAISNDTLTWTPAAPGGYAFLVKALDDRVPPLASYASFTVNVLAPPGPGTNHPPVAAPVPDQQVRAGAAVQADLTATDADGNAVTWTSTTLPAGATLVGRTFSWTPAAADAGIHYVIFSVTDDGTPPLHDEVLLRIEVLPGTQNLPPKLWSLPAPGQLAPCEQFHASFEALDPEGGALTFSAVDLPPGASLQPKGGGLVELSWTPDATQQDSSFMVVIYVTDDGVPRMSDSIVYEMQVLAIPPPDLAWSDPITVVGGTVGTIRALRSSACYGVTASNLPAGATYDPATATVTWPTTGDDFGLYDILFTLETPIEPPQVTTRVVVQYSDAFTSLARWSQHNVGGPVTWTQEAYPTAVDGQALHSSTPQAMIGTMGRAYRSFTRSEVGIGAIDWTITGVDQIACISPAFAAPGYSAGGIFEILSTAVVDPGTTWPDIATNPDAMSTVDVPHETPGTVSGTAYIGGSREVTVVLRHWDEEVNCSIDVWWDSVLLTPTEYQPQ